MPTLRVDTFPGQLASVEIRSFESPYTLLDTASGVDIVEVLPGVYEVQTVAAGQWLLRLLDSNNELIGIKYASEDYLQATDYAPWLNVTTTPDLGPFVLTITVQDDLLAPLAGVTVRVVKGALSATAITNALGVAVFNVGVGDWDIVISHPGYTYTPITVSVAADTAQTITLVDIVVTTPSNPSLAVVNFYIWGDEGPLANARILARLEDQNSRTANYLASTAQHAATTDISGFAQIQLLRFAQFTVGGVYLVEVFDSNDSLLYSKRVKVPDLDSLNATQLIEVV